MQQRSNKKSSHTSTPLHLTELGDSPSFQAKAITILHSSLEIEDVLNNFYKVVQHSLKVSGLTYRPAVADQHALSYGQRKRHSCQYNLKYQSSELGKLIFTRPCRFAEDELALLEALIGVLVMPLRNAILYSEAIANALRDALTKTGNRAALDSVLQREVILAQRNKHPLSLIICDIDHFKTINDQYGHTVGDNAIIHFVEILRTKLRKSDQVFRFGGEEFVIVLPGTNNLQVMTIAERIREVLNNNPLTHQKQKIAFSASFGVGTLQANESCESFFERTDMAMYSAKQGGRNCCVNGEFGAVLRSI